MKRILFILSFILPLAFTSCDKDADDILPPEEVKPIPENIGFYDGEDFVNTLIIEGIPSDQSFYDCYFYHQGESYTINLDGEKISEGESEFGKYDQYRMSIGNPYPLTITFTATFHCNDEVFYFTIKQLGRR